MSNLFFYILSIFFISSLQEKITLTDITLKQNSLFKFHKFTYNNYSRKGPVNQGFNASLQITHNATFPSFFIFILASPSFKTNTTALCLNISDENFTLSSAEYFNVANINETSTTVENQGRVQSEGVYRTFFIFCNNNNNDNNSDVKISGTIWYYNTNSYTSAENFYQVQVYLILTFYYAALTLYWIVKMILNYNRITLFLTLFSIAIPFVIIENIMRLEFFSGIDHQGEYNHLFKIIEYSFRIVKNVLIRIIYFLISINYSKFYKLTKQNIKIFVIFIASLSAYTISSVFYEIYLVVYETAYTHPIGYLFFSSLLLILCNIYIWYYMFERLKKNEKDCEAKGFTKSKELMNSFSYVIYIAFIIAIIHSLLFILEWLMLNHFAIVYMKWIVDLTEQSISLVVFTNIVILLWRKNDIEKNGYVYDTELNKSNQGGSVIRENTASNKDVTVPQQV